MANLEERTKRARQINRELKKLFPHATCSLNYSNPWELMVAVQLSAQCTDKRVNIVTEKLFRKYHTLDEYADARPSEFEKDIFQTGFYRNKTKNILAAARLIREVHGGRVPRTMKEILEIPGVARKTANVVLGNAYGVVEGIAVDTHVKRLSRLLGLSRQTQPEKIEQDLIKLLPPEEWMDFTHRLIEYGRAYCVARRHDHANCPLTKKLETFI